MNYRKVLDRIVKQIREAEPDAEMILYGSYVKVDKKEDRPDKNSKDPFYDLANKEEYDI